MRYVYRKGGLRPPVSPDQAAAEINRIRLLCTSDDDLPKMLVRYSRDVTAPFHSVIYRHTPAECEVLWREHLARKIISTVWIIEEDVNDPGSEALFVPAFPSIAGTETRQRSYEPVEVAMASSEMRDALLADAKQRLKNVRVKYRNLQELALIWSVIDEEVG